MRLIGRLANSARTAHPRVQSFYYAEKDVPDPYFTGNFDEVFRLVSDGSRGLLATIREQEGL